MVILVLVLVTLLHQLNDEVETNVGNVHCVLVAVGFITLMKNELIKTITVLVACWYSFLFVYGFIG